MANLRLRRPIDIARGLGISTSTLRHYEDWGIVPPVSRTENGYRVYSPEHLAYFRCIRAMEPGFCMKLTGNVMRKLLTGNVDEALWIVAEAKAELVRERRIAEQAIRMLDDVESKVILASGMNEIKTIGDVTRVTGISSTAIRYWEQNGLLATARDSTSGYRLFDINTVKKVLLIRTLRTGGYSLYTIKHVLAELDISRSEQAKQVALESLRRLERRNRELLRGEHALYTLCQTLGFLMESQAKEEALTK